MKTKKKLMTALLTLVIMCMCATSVFATSSPAAGSTAAAPKADSTATVNVATGNAKDTLSAYKVIAASFDPDTNNLTNEFTALFQNFQKSSDGTAYVSLTVDGYTALESNSEELNTLLGAFTKYVRTQSPVTDADYTAVTDADGKAVFENVAMGQYIITGSGNSTGAIVYQTVTAEVVPEIVDGAYVIYPSYDVKMKTTTPGGSKTVSGTKEDTKNKTQTAGIGDELTYTLSADVPVYPEGATNTTMYMKDTLSSGLTLSSTADSIVVKGYTNAQDTAGTVLVKDKDYTVTINGQQIYIDLTYASVKGYAKVTAEYKAVVNEKAVVSTGSNDNDYKYYFSNDPFNGGTYEPGKDHPDDKPGYGKSEDVVKVYTYRFQIHKYDANTTTTNLAGAVFEIKDSSKNVVATVTTDANGMAAYTGLAAGTYTYKETKAPTGYKLDPNEHEFTIDSENAVETTTTTRTIEYTSVQTDAKIKTQARDDKGNLLYVDADGNVSTTKTDDNSAAYVKTITTNVVTEGTEGAAADAGTYTVGVANKPGSSLPTTGGMGTILFTMIGCAIIAVTVILYTNRKRTAGSAK